MQFLHITFRCTASPGSSLRLRQVVRSITQIGDEAGITPREGRESNVAGVGERRALTERFDGVRTSYGSGKGRFEDLAAADKETRITRCWCAAGDGDKGEELTAMASFAGFGVGDADTGRMLSGWSAAT